MSGSYIARFQVSLFSVLLGILSKRTTSQATLPSANETNSCIYFISYFSTGTHTAGVYWKCPPDVFWINMENFQKAKNKKGRYPLSQSYDAPKLLKSLIFYNHHHSKWHYLMLSDLISDMTLKMFSTSGFSQIFRIFSNSTKQTDLALWTGEHGYEWDLCLNTDFHKR